MIYKIKTFIFENFYNRLAKSRALSFTKIRKLINFYKFYHK